MFLVVSFFGSVQLTFLGIIGEYIFRIYKEVQKRPIYLVKEIYETSSDLSEGVPSVTIKNEQSEIDE